MKRTLILTAAIAVSVAGLLVKSTPGEAQESKFNHTENAIATSMSLYSILNFRRRRSVQQRKVWLQPTEEQ